MAQTHGSLIIDRAGPEALADATARGRPAVIRRLTADWPIVQAAGRGREALSRYLEDLDEGKEAEMFHGPPEIGGRFFYSDDFRGLNFERRRSTVTALLRSLAEAAASERPPALYMGAAATRQTLPKFEVTHRLTGLPHDAIARIWIGNAVTIQTHYDASSNLACVVGGRRTFTLFPPEQAANLYVGPLEFTMAGQPASVVDLAAPDLERHPRFAEALKHAVTLELEPGDALFIPPLWWHNVRSHGPLNVLVNYWWTESSAGGASPFEALVHGLLAVRSLPPGERAAWRAMFEHFVFDPEPMDHIPPDAQGVAGPLTPATAMMMRRFLIGALSRKPT